jgi:DNA-binding Lrp family transcriptional regulator
MLNYSIMLTFSMSHVRSIEASRDETSDLEARIIKAIGRAGPRNVAQISRMTGAHQETIRYKIKKRFDRLGFKFHAEVDYDKIGLSLHWATLKFSRTHHGMAPQILRALNQVGYLAYFAKVVPQGDYTALFTLPADSASQYGEFLSGLQEKGILADFALDEVLVRRHKIMDPRFFNFRSGRWEVEWAKVAAEPPAPLSPGKKPRAEDFDYYDLLVIKELQKDALQHLTEIARKLKVHQKTLEYHYRTHVQKWKLVPSYRIRWARDTTRRPAHSTTFTRLAFNNLSRAEFTEVQGAISKVPFLWLEDLLQSGTYIASMYVPVTDLQSVLNYIGSSVPNLGSKIDVGFVNYSEASSFTIPYNMYQNNAWKFDVHQMERALKKESIVPLQK